MPPPAVVPMQSIAVRSACRSTLAPLVVMLPGAYSRPRDFVDEGFVDALRSRGVDADVQVVDAHLRYYEDKTIVERLRQDVVRPALARGVPQVWLVGISLGGFGALGYAARHGDEIAGVLALAPYLGRRSVLQELEAAGGPAAWRRRSPPPEADDLEREVWRWAASAPPAPPVWLGFGRDDRFADANRLFGSLLPPERRFDTAGGHDWPPWRALWGRWLDEGLLGRDCAAAA